MATSSSVPHVPTTAPSTQAAVVSTAVKDEPAGDDNDESGGLFGDMFTNESSYKLQHFQFGSGEGAITMGAWLSLASTTDFDLTGQILWPGTQLMGHFIAHALGRSLLTKRNALELGSGAGVAGLCAYGICHQLVLSDHNDIVLRLLQRNIDYAASSSSSSSSSSSAAKPIEHKQSSSTSSATSSPLLPMAVELNWGDALPSQLTSIPKGIDVILGSDIVYSSSAAAELLRTVHHLLSPNGSPLPSRVAVPSVTITTIDIPLMTLTDINMLANGTQRFWILSYVSRWSEVDRAFHSWVAHHGLTCMRVPAHFFVPDGAPVHPDASLLILTLQQQPQAATPTVTVPSSATASIT